MKIIWFSRIFIFYLLLIPATISISLIGNVLFFMPEKIIYQIITSWSRFFIFSLKLICGIKYEVIGKNKLPAEPCVVLSNHQSAWETIFMQVLLPQQSWILKKELKYIPFFGWGLSLLKPIYIDRTCLYSVKYLIKEGMQRLKSGKWVVIFPEGTRSKPGVDKSYSPSGAALAIKAGVNIVPISHNAGLCWPRGIIPKKSGKVTVVIGSPINSIGKDPRELTMQVKQWIKNNQKL